MGFASVIAAALLAAQPAPDSGPPDETGLTVSEVESVTVYGRALEEAAEAFVDQVTEVPRGTRLARWNRPVCISISNMQPRYAQYIIDQIALTALELDIEVGEPSCSPNVIIFATSNGDALAQRLVSETGYGFRPADQHTDLGRQALRDFQEAGTPVRWWNVVMPVTLDTGDRAITLRGETQLNPEFPLAVRVRDSSRMRSNIRYDMAWTIVIMDMTKVGDVSLAALADYVGMVSLAQVDPQADVSGQETVLNLFAGDQTVSGLTSWDRDYLTALYRAPNDRADGARQQDSVEHFLVRERRQAQEAGEAPQGE
jgi:hypothetical protein